MLRRLAPDCSRIELASLPATHDAVKLLFAMGFETANVHLGSAKAAADLLCEPRAGDEVLGVVGVTARAEG